MSDNIEHFISELRKRWLDPKSLTFEEFRALRRKHGVSLSECSDILSIGAEAIFNAEYYPKSYVDGGIARVLNKMFEGLVPPVPELEAPEVQPELAPLIDRIVRRLDDLAADSSPRTWTQSALAAIDILVEEAGITTFTTKHRDPTAKIDLEIREAFHSILGLDYKKQIQPAWLLYRHVQCGTRPQMAMQFCRQGRLEANTALLDFDERGWSSSRSRTTHSADRKGTALKKQEKSSGRSSGRHPVAGRNAKKRLDAAERTESQIGSLLLHLRAIRTEFSADSELITLIEGITSSVEPIHHTLKQLVLGRATAVKRRRPSSVTNPTRENDNA